MEKIDEKPAPHERRTAPLDARDLLLQEALAEDRERSARLVRITAALAEAVTAQDVYEAVVDSVGVALSASTAALWRLDDDEGSSASIVRCTGYSPAQQKALEGVPLDGPGRIPALDALQRAEPLWFDSKRALIAAYPSLATVASPEREYSVACLPLVVGGRCTGVLGLSFDAPVVGAPSRSFLELVARYAALALERLSLLEDERKSRAAAEQANARLLLISRASQRFHEDALDQRAVLHALVDDVTATWADGCGVFLLDEQREALELGAVGHRVPAALDLIRKLFEAQPLSMSHEDALNVRAARTGAPVVMNGITPSADEVERAPAPIRSFVEQFLPRAAVVVPLLARGRVLGTLSAIRNDEGNGFLPDDVRLLEELAARAAAALENRRLHDETERARARTEVLYRLVRDVSEAERIEQAYDAALDALEQAAGTTRSAILTLGPGDDALHFRAWRGVSEAYRQAVDGHSPWALDARAPAPLVFPDVEDAPALEQYSELFRAESIRGVAFFPLTAGGKLLGKLMLYFDAPRHLTDAEHDLVTTIARHVAAALERSNAEAVLRTTVRFNEMFTGMLGHDLRNPLGAIMTAGQYLLLKMGDDDERRKKPIGRILASGERMARMIDQLLDFTRVRVGQGIPLERRSVDLVALVQEAADELTTAHPDARLDVSSLGETVGAFDPDRLHQVFSNLLANAIRHGAPGGHVDVVIDGRSQGEVRVTVHNEGAIPAHLLPHLFEPMAGGVHGREKSQGLGLGLFITREIVRAHGGRIAVESDEASGTALEVVVPRRAGLDARG